MKISERGQITIPKEMRERFSLTPLTEVEFQIVKGELVLRKKSRAPKTRIRDWTGFLNGQPADIDQFIEDIRGR
jgi:AbrB family looped-hinge helix DNA binding protein